MTQTLYGRNPVYESLRAARRAASRLLLAEGVSESGILADILRLAGERGLPVERVPRQTLDRRAGGVNHQGVLLLTGPYPYVELESILEIAAFPRYESDNNVLTQRQFTALG